MKAAQRLKNLPEVSLTEHRVPEEDATDLILGTRSYIRERILHSLFTAVPKDETERYLDMHVRDMMMELADELSHVADKLREAAR